MVLENLHPKNAWSIFETIFASTPRPSNHEDRIRAKIAGWATQNAKKGISCHQDPAGNLLLRKKASPGCETWPAVMLQGHMDMVCETSRPDGYNFLDEPIQVRIDPDGEWISADGTTLGADDGLGASIALGLLLDDDPAFVHGPIEVLLTFAEETGLDGAYKLDPAALGVEARYVINVDSEELGVITIGSAGGGSVKIEKTIVPEERACLDSLAWFELTVSGLRGGHSGVDIHLPRANAIKLVARLLCAVIQKVEIFLSSWEGGTRGNAIPRSSVVRFAAKSEDKDVLSETVKNESAKIERYYKSKLPGGDILEPEIHITLNEAKHTTCITSDKTAEIVRLANGLPSGPHRFSPTLPSLVETSDNLAIVKSSLNEGHIEFLLSVRSNVDDELESFRRSIASIGQLASWHVTLSDAYPAWPPEPGSRFMEFVRKKYEGRFGKPVDVRAVHAGLECSIIAKKMAIPAKNIISIGPEIQNAHSPAERARIADIQVLYDILKDILRDANQLPRG
ncbi:MAG: beta-Ala-His dipeptidase [Candidatus Sigynarchaeota archaeon]